MSKTYNNVEMSKEAADQVAKTDATWTGPRLIILSFVTLGLAFALLYAMANNIIGPTFHQ